MEEEGWRSEEFDQLPSLGESSTQSSSRRSSLSVFRTPCGFFKKSKRLFCSGVFLKGSAYAVGFWNPSKGLRAMMAIIVLFVDTYYFFDAVYYAFVCRHFETSLNSWFCRNITVIKSLAPTSPHILHGIELDGVLSAVANFAALISNAAFFWCMWKLKRRTVHCVTLEKAYSRAGRSIWAKLNCTMLIFGFCLLTNVFWFNFTFKGSVYTVIEITFNIIPMWAILTSSWIFVIITNAMKDCVTMCHAEIRNAVDCSLDDVIRIHKRLCKQMSSTSESLKLWFVIHWILLAITAVIYVADLAYFFDPARDWLDLYHAILVSVTPLYVFVYPSYCAASVTTQCNQMLKELNMTTDEDWPTGHPFHNRSQLALFLQYAAYTNCGFQIGEVAFGNNFAWFSTLIAMCGLGVKVL